MSDLNEQKIVGPKGLVIPSESEFREQVLVKALRAFDNPLEALGIFMRETSVTAVVDDDGLSFDKGYDKLYSKPMNGSCMIEVFGQDILNTLKEGK